MTKKAIPSAHTPAPWKYGEDAFNLGNGIVYANTGYKDAPQDICKLHGWSNTQQANARLIAAAPELLGILMDIVDESDSPSDTILGFAADDALTDFLMDEYNLRTQA